MSDYLIQDTTLTEIADAVRERNNTTVAIPCSDMARQIREGTERHIDTSTITDFTYWHWKGIRANTAGKLDTSNGIIFDSFLTTTVTNDAFPNGYPFEKLNTSKGVSFRSFLFDSDVTELDDFFIDTSNAEDMAYFFYGCVNLQSGPRLKTTRCKDLSYFYCECESLKEIPEIDTSNAENLTYMFRFCKELKNISQIDTNNCTNFSFMFDTCHKLTEVPALDTSNGIKFSNMFANCPVLVTIGELDLTNATEIHNLFRNDYALETITNLKFNSMPTSKMSSNIFYKATKLANITITGTIKVDSNHLTLAHCPDLTVESMLSILNALEDNTGEETTYTVYFGSTNLAKLTDEQQAIVTNKNIKLG